MLILSTLLTLSSSAVTLRRDKSVLYSRIAIIILINSSFFCLNSLYLNFYEKSLGIFSGLLQTTATVHIFHLFIILISATILLLNSFYPRKIWSEQYSSFFKLLTFKLKYYNSFILNKMAEQYKLLEYPLIILFVVIGGTLLMSSSDLITIFLAIELQSYGLYVLCVMYRNSEGATSGGLSYFLLGGLSSCFILLASALLYGNSGNSNFDGLFVINSISTTNLDLLGEYYPEETVRDAIYKSFIDIYKSNYLNLSLIIMASGFLFKISAAPFHFWSPDVYDAIPTVVTTFVSTFAKISILILLLELVHYTTNTIEQKDELYNFSWTFILLMSSFLSLIVGAVLGLTQYRIKRLYAYSTISHIGFILLALSINSMESIQSFLFYLMQYSITNVNAFVIIIAIGYTLYLYTNNKESNDNKKDELRDENIEINNSPIQLLEQLKGYFYINPYIALSLAITLFSFVGIPPLLGFFAKQMVLSSALDKGYIFMVLIAILTSAISACYYLVIVKDMYFNKVNYEINPNLDKTALKAHIYNNNKQINIDINISNIQLSGSISLTISILTLIILLFMLTPQEWLNITAILATILNN